MISQQSLFFFKSSLSSFSSFICSLSIFIVIITSFFIFLFCKFLSFFCWNVDSGKPFIKLFMRRRVKKNSIFRYPSTTLVKFIAFLRDSESNDISMVQAPVVVVDILSVGDYKSTGTERDPTSTNNLLFRLYFIFRLNLCKTDFDFALNIHNFHFKVTVFGLLLELENNSLRLWSLKSYLVVWTSIIICFLLNDKLWILSFDQRNKLSVFEMSLLKVRKVW